MLILASIVIVLFVLNVILTLLLRLRGIKLARIEAPKRTTDNSEFMVASISIIKDEGLNPATGLPMAGGFDLNGNMYGFGD